MNKTTPLPSSQERARRAAKLTALVMAHGLAAQATQGQSAPAPAAGPGADSDGLVELPELNVEGQPYRAVSSPKFTAPVVDLPQTVAVIPREIFNQQGARDLTDVLRNTPGITFNAGENGFASGLSNFSMRGFDASGSIFVDGVRDSGNYNRDVFNTEQVEVVKGAAADNGRAAAGGYVNLGTKTARAGNFQQGTLSFGFDEDASKNRHRATLDVNQQVGEGAAVRLNALWQDGGIAGRNVAERNSWAVAPSLALGLGKPTRLSLAYQHLETNDRPDWGVSGALIAGMNTHQANAGGKSNRDNFYGHATDFDDVTSDSIVARVEHDFSPALRLTNQTRWSQTDREALYALPGGYNATTRLVTTQRQAYTRDNTAFSNLTNLSAAFETGSLRHTLASGLEFSREESTGNRYPTNGVLGNPGSTPVDNPDPNRALTGFVGLVPTQVSEATVDTVAGYIYDTVAFNEKWQATGGLRLESYEVDLESRTAAGAPQGPDGYHRSATTLSGKVGVAYKPQANGSLYAAVGVAALPPGSFLSNPDISREGDNAFPGWSTGINSEDSKVQRSINYELGAKWNFFENRLNTSAALFRTERRNVAISGRTPGDPTSPVVLQGYGEQVVQGLELGAAGQISPAWSVFGGVLFLDSERKHSAYLDEARRLATVTPANPLGDYGNAATTSGDELAFNPRFSASLWTTYRLPIGLTVGGGVRHVGSSYLGRPDDAERIIPNGNSGKLPAHTVVDLLLTYQINERLTLRINVDNVTDKFYALSSNWNGSRVFTGSPRACLLSADVRF